MDELRWILLALGTLIVVGVYGYARWQDRRGEGLPWQRKRRQRPEREPFAGEDLPLMDEGDPLFNESHDDVIGPVRVRSADAGAPEPEPVPEPEPGPEPLPESEPMPSPVQSLPPQPAAGPEPTRAREAESEPSPVGSAADAAAARPVPPFLRRRGTGEKAQPPGKARPAVEAGTAKTDLQPALDLGDPGGTSGTMVTDDQGEEKIVALSVMAPVGQPWSGDAIAECLVRRGLKLDAQGVFRQLQGRAKNAPVLYTVANIVEPGTFEPGALAELSTPGVVFIMQLPGRFDGLSTFEQMLGTARALAEQLQGQLLDGRRCDLTQQVLEHMREELREYRRRARLAGRQPR